MAPGVEAEVLEAEALEAEALEAEAPEAEAPEAEAPAAEAKLGPPLRKCWEIPRGSSRKMSGKCRYLHEGPLGKS